MARRGLKSAGIHATAAATTTATTATTTAIKLERPMEI